MKGEKVLTLLSRGQLFQGHLESDTGAPIIECSTPTWWVRVTALYSVRFSVLISNKKAAARSPNRMPVDSKMPVTVPESTN